MPLTITDAELANSLAEILDRVHEHQEEFSVQRNGAVIARISPPDDSREVTLQDVARKLRHLKMPGDGFADDIEEAQRNQGLAEFPEWPS